MAKVGHVFLCRTNLSDVSRKHRIYCRLIRLLGWSRWDHVCVGYDGVVVSVSACGYKFWPIKTFVEHHPGVEVFFDVPFQYDIDMTLLEGRKEPSFWMTLLRWALRGRWPFTRDCVCVTLECLISGGVEIPETLVSPRAVADWLKEHEYGTRQIPKRYGASSNCRGISEQA